MKNAVSRALIERIPGYLSYLEKLRDAGVASVSSTTISRELGLGEVQVRKDLGTVSGAGRPRIGYQTVELIDHLQKFLGSQEPSKAVLVGAGRLGLALLHYNGFEQFGVQISAAFDRESATIAVQHPGKPILPMGELETYCRENGVKIGIITVPAEAAQSVCDRLCDAGITAVWNFTPVVLTVPESVSVRNEKLAISLNMLRQSARQ